MSLAIKYNDILMNIVVLLRYKKFYNIATRIFGASLSHRVVSLFRPHSAELFNVFKG